MFIETLKGLVTTLVSVLIFISAVQLIAPNNKMQKYIKFILGLIMITVILNPILEFISNGQEDISQGISKYEQVFSQSQSKNKNNTDATNDSKNEENINDTRTKAFIKNFNKNCDSLLKNKYKNMDFKSEIDCDVNFMNMSLDIKKLRIGISDEKIKKIKKIDINSSKSEDVNTKEDNDQYEDVINFVSTELDVPKDKIEVYKLEE